MKMSDEIKKGLECCINDTYGCNGKCPYFNSLSNGVDCAVKMHADALAYIQQLERGIKIIAESNASAYKKRDSLEQRIIQLQAKCHQLERERDALVEAIRDEGRVSVPFIKMPCRYCDAEGKFTGERCNFCHAERPFGGFKWRGVKEE